MYKINYPSFFVTQTLPIHVRRGKRVLRVVLCSWTGSGYSVSASSRKEQQRSLALLAVRLVLVFFVSELPSIALDKVYMIPKCSQFDGRGDDPDTQNNPTSEIGSGTNWKWFSSHTYNFSASPTVMFIGDPESTTMFPSVTFKQ